MGPTRCCTPSSTRPARLRRDALSPQVEAAISSGASGIAVLGLGTEVHKLGRDERRALVEWTLAEVRGRVPVAVTVADGNVPDTIESARFAVAGRRILADRAAAPAAGERRPSRPVLRRHRRQCRVPVGIQNAPEFLGIGLSPGDLLALNGAHPNVVWSRPRAPRSPWPGWCRRSTAGCRSSTAAPARARPTTCAPGSPA